MFIVLRGGKFFYITTELPSGAFTVNFFGEGADIQLKMNQLTMAPEPRAIH